MEMLGARQLRVQEIADQGPAAGGRRRPQPHQWPARIATHPWTEHPQREKGVVRDLAGPDHVPERVQNRVLVTRAGRVIEVAEEGCAAALQVIA